MFAEHSVKPLCDWLLLSLKEYKAHVKPQDLEQISTFAMMSLSRALDVINGCPELVTDVQKQVAHTQLCLDNISTHIMQTLSLVDVILTLSVATTTFTLFLTIGEAFQKSFGSPIDWKPTWGDMTMLGTATIATWAPGMSIWGAAAGTVLLTTPVGVVASVPLICVASATAGFYLGRRALSIMH